MVLGIKSRALDIYILGKCLTTEPYPLPVFLVFVVVVVGGGGMCVCATELLFIIGRPGNHNPPVFIDVIFYTCTTNPSITES